MNFVHARPIRVVQTTQVINYNFFFLAKKKKKGDE